MCACRNCKCEKLCSETEFSMLQKVKLGFIKSTLKHRMWEQEKWLHIKTCLSPLFSALWHCSTLQNFIMSSLLSTCMHYLQKLAIAKPVLKTVLLGYIEPSKPRTHLTQRLWFSIAVQNCSIRGMNCSTIALVSNMIYNTSTGNISTASKGCCFSKHDSLFTQKFAAVASWFLKVNY